MPFCILYNAVSEIHSSAVGKDGRLAYSDLMSFELSL